MQDQEGFCKEGQFELIEFNYVPTSTVKPYRPRQYSHQLKLKTEPPPDPSPFLDQTLQQELKQAFKLRNGSRLVYEAGVSCSQAPWKESLVFDSNYEGANLEYVTSEDLRHYDLYIKADTNTKQHFQWFCFKVKNQNLKKATLTIKNLAKANMLYKQGLRPYCRSTQSTQVQYQQINSPVTFQHAQEEEDQESPSLELTFQLTFTNFNDQLEICSQPPYPYSRFLKSFKKSIFTRITLAKSIMGHNIEAFLLNDIESTKAVAVVFARQHPGESVSSWMMEGLASRLAELPCPEVQWLLVPMVNVDGVILGNNRTGLLGFDFNRHWYIDKQTNRFHLFPQLMGILRYLKKRQKEWTRKVKIFIDLHGHSSQPNVFCYGPPHHKASEHYDSSRLFPYLIQLKNKDFNFGQCSYEISPQKKHCARSVFLERLGFHYSYTVESSFGIYGGRNINENDMVKMGKSICEATLDFLKLLVNPSKIKSHSSIQELNKKLRECQQAEQLAIQDDSDSEEEVQNEGRLHFQEKMAQILAYKSEAKDIQLGSSVELTQKTKGEETGSKELPGMKSSSLRYRFKTEIKQSMKDSPREDSLFLPRIKVRSRNRRSGEEKGVAVTFNNMSLNQIKEKLYCIRNSKFGRKLLIG